MRINSTKTGAKKGIPLMLWWSISLSIAFALGVFYAHFLLDDEPIVGTVQVAGDTKVSKPRQLLNLPDTVKYVYINIGTSWDPWPGEYCRRCAVDHSQHVKSSSINCSCL